MLSGSMVPLALRYHEVSKGIIFKFDESILADMCEPLVSVLEGRCLRMECFSKECGSVGSGMWNPPTQAIDDGAMNAELLIANGTSFVIDRYSVASQCKLCQRHKTCLEMRYMKNILQRTYVTILIHNWDHADSHSVKSTFDAANEELVLQPCIFLEDGAVMMHVVCCTTVLDPDSIDFPNRCINHCLVTVCEAAEYGTECLAVIVVARFSIAKTTECTLSMAT